MTSRNPASANPNPNNYLSPDILAKVNAHADRTMDRLFADLDEILSGDLSAPTSDRSAGDGDAAAPPPPIYPQSPNQIPQTILPPNISSDRQQNNYPAYYQQQQYRSTDRQQYSPPPPTDIEPPTPIEEPKGRRKSKPTAKKQSLPLWMKIFLGIGVGAVGLSSLLFWAIDRNKLSLPQSADLSFLPFGTKSSISQDDAKFAEYMRKSIAKIERANNTPTAPAAATAPASNNVPAPAPTTEEPGTIASTNPTSNFPSVTLLKILPTGDKPGAQFEIQGKFEIFRVGEKIGGSDWTLITVAKGEAIVKKTSGEIRSIFVGQKF
jgi:hypothetical protein